MTGLAVPARAKINLGLELLGRRRDGYHDLVTVMQTISLHDLVLVAPGQDREIRFVGQAPEPGLNSVLCAWRELEGALGVSLPARITVWKRIPAGAGLGGASSDAAAALRGLANLHSLPVGGSLLAQVAARVGSDVPFFVRGGAALAEGRGERLTPVPGYRGWVALAMPREPALTAAVYARVGPSDFTDGQATISQVGGEGAATPHRGRMAWRNALTRAAHEEVAGLSDFAQRLGDGWRMTGSGSAHFALCESRAAAEDLRRRAAGIAAWTSLAALVEAA